MQNNLALLKNIIQWQKIISKWKSYSNTTFKVYIYNVSVYKNCQTTSFYIYISHIYNIFILYRFFLTLFHFLGKEEFRHFWWQTVFHTKRTVRCFKKCSHNWKCHNAFHMVGHKGRPSIFKKMEYPFYVACCEHISLFRMLFIYSLALNWQWPSWNLP